MTADVPENVAKDSAGNGNEAAQQFSVTVDIDAPTVTITGPTDVQTGPFNVTITFSEDVTDFIADDIAVGNGSVTAFEGVEATYKATITPTASGTVTVDIPENVAEDSAGNPNEAAQQFSVTADVDAPTVTITGPTDVQTGPFDVTITFSEDVTDFIADDIAVGNGSVTAFEGEEATYKATITPTASGTVTADVPENAGKDSAGNGNEAAEQFSVTTDMDPPTVTITGPTDVQTGPFDITITFSEDVTGFIADDIAVGNGSVTAFEGVEATYKATINPTASGTVTVDIPENAGKDSAGNPSEAAQQFSVTADVDAPTVTITGPTDVQTGPFNVTITFSEDVTDFIADDIAIGNGSVTAFSGSGANYKVTITPTASGTVTADIPENVAKDSAGNGNEAAEQFSVTTDMDPPTVTITGPTDVQTGPFDITITFSEDVTGFIADDITVGNGSVTAFEGEEANYKATITPTTSGTVTADIPENAAKDSAGNPNEAAQQFSVAADMDPPTVGITGPTTAQAGAFDITITFSEDVTDFIADDIAVSNGSVTAFSGSGATYKATITSEQ